MQTLVHLHESDAFGRLERAERGPHPALRGIVHRYCGFEHRGTGVARRREVAQDQVTIILGFGPPLSVSGPGFGTSKLASFLAPLCDSYAITEEQGELHGIQVDFSPLGAFMLLGMPMSWLADQIVVPFEDVLGDPGRLLVERLAAGASWERRFELLDEWIGRRIIDAAQPAPDVVRAWSRLRDTGGTVPIGALSAELGCSRRHLAARFQEQVGASPKTAARLLRFQRAVSLLSRDDGSRFAEIAQACGYYDQPHLNRDFRELGGCAPGEFVASVLPEGIGVAA